MKFLDPTNDLVFKKIFGNLAKKNILISFLNAVLGFKNNNLIVDVEILNPYQLPKIEELKETILDIKPTDQTGQNFLVEMQKNDKKDFTKRSLYYASKAYVEQLNKSGNYKNLKKVYFIGIINFKAFSEKNYISQHLILNRETKKQEIKDLEFVFIELPKFNKSLKKCDSVIDKWLYFLRNTQNLEIIPEEFNNLPDFQDAFQIANSFGWNKQELEIYDYMRLKEMDKKNEIETAENKGFTKGKEEGIKEGIEKRNLEIAKNLLDILDNKTISLKTGLTIKQIQNLRKN